MGSGNGSRAHVVVLGGGFGGLETAFSLRMLAGERARITLVSDQRCFLFKPNSIYVPFGLDPDKLRVPLERPTGRKGIELVQARAREIDPERREVRLEGLSLPYDFLVVATGAGMRPAEVPGLAEHAISTWTPVDMLRLRAGFESLIEAAMHGERRRVLFVIPPNNKCAGPLYEIVLMLDTWLRRKGARESVEVVWTTYESSYIQAFGPRLHEVVSAEFEGRGVVGHHDWAVTASRSPTPTASGSATTSSSPSRPTSPRPPSPACRPTSAASSRPSWPAAGSPVIPRSSPSATPATSPSSRPSWPSCRRTPPPHISAPRSSAASRSRASTRSACA